MRILHVVRQFHPALGGLEDFVLSLARQQRKQGLSPQVVTLNRMTRGSAKRWPPRDVVEGIPVRRVGFFGSPRYPIAPGVLSGLSDCDLIHVHGVDFFCDYLALTRIVHGKPMVLSTHGGFFHTPYAHALKKLFFNTVTRLSLTQYDRVVANSTNDLDLFRRITSKRLTMIENGVNTQKFSRFGAPDYKPGIVTIGRFSVNKRLDRLVDMFDRVASEIPDARLHIVGNDFDGLLPELRRHIATLTNGSKVHVHTGLSDEDLRAVLEACSFFASASEYEGFGQTVVEAMSAGLLPMVNRIKSFETILGDEPNGLISDFSDPARAAAEAVAFMRRQEARFAETRAEVIAASDRYGWPGTERKFAAVYESILGTAGARASTEVVQDKA